MLDVTKDLHALSDVRHLHLFPDFDFVGWSVGNLFLALWSYTANRHGMLAGAFQGRLRHKFSGMDVVVSRRISRGNIFDWSNLNIWVALFYLFCRGDLFLTSLFSCRFSCCLSLLSCFSFSSINLFLFDFFLHGCNIPILSYLFEAQQVIKGLLNLWCYLTFVTVWNFNYSLNASICSLIVVTEDWGKLDQRLRVFTINYVIGINLLKHFFYWRIVTKIISKLFSQLWIFWGWTIVHVVDGTWSWVNFSVLGSAFAFIFWSIEN